MSLGIPIDAQVWIVDSGVDVATTVRELVAEAHARGVAEALARWESLIANWKHAAEGYQRGADDESMPELLRRTDAARAEVYRVVVQSAEQNAGPAPGDVKR